VAASNHSNPVMQVRHKDGVVSTRLCFLGCLVHDPMTTALYAEV
jgi:hypothetical protein